MIVKLTRVNPSFSVENTKLSYDASIKDASYVVSYNNITPAIIEVGLFLLKHAAFDEAIFSEVVGLGTVKPFADTWQASDETSLQIDYFRDFSDTSQTTDFTTLGVGTAPFDTATFNSAIDVITFDTSKLLTELPVTTDEVRFDTAKALSELIGVTDDLDGEAVIDDDQTMTFVKVTSDAFSVGEVIQVTNNFYRTKIETPSITDTVISTTTKVLAELGTFEGVVSFDTTKLINELAVVLEDATFSTNKSRTDIGRFTDSVALQFAWQRAFSDAGITSDNTTFAVGRTLSDTGVAQDAYSRQVNYSRAFQETSIFSDTTSFAVTYDKADNGYVVETDVKSINKLRSESATLADSGLLVSQGYVDNNDYFAETYVGVSRTF
jgi:hypothetical protein